MINIHGIKILIADADILIAQMVEDDENHDLTETLNNKIKELGVTIIFPNTAIAEAITSLLRRHSNPAAAEYIRKLYLDRAFNVEYINEKIMMEAAKLFNPSSSKKNTFFDALVAATAKKLNADAIFSFDDWYTKMGFKLVKDLI